MAVTSGLGVEQRDDGWTVAGHAGDPEDLRLCNDYLGYLADRNYAAGTRRSYAFDLLAFARWLERNVTVTNRACMAVTQNRRGAISYCDLCPDFRRFRTTATFFRMVVVVVVEDRRRRRRNGGGGTGTGTGTGMHQVKMPAKSDPCIEPSRCSYGCQAAVGISSRSVFVLVRAL
jgi:hypothetical protein